MTERDKKKSRRQPTSTGPLCMFNYNDPDESNDQDDYDQSTSYIASTRRTVPSKTQKLTPPHRRRAGRSGQKLSSLQKRRELSSSDENDGKGQTSKDRGISKNNFRRDLNWKQQRKLKKTPVPNLTSYLLTTTKPSDPPARNLPTLIEVLDTLKDAWPTEKHPLCLERVEECKKDDIDMKESAPVPASQQAMSRRLLPRRRSVPEEIIRKFNVSKDRTSESETNATMPEATSPSSKEADEKTINVSKTANVEKRDKIKTSAFSQRIEEGSISPKQSMADRDPNSSFKVLIEESVQYSAEEGSSDSDSDAPGVKRFNTIKRAPLRRNSVVQESLEKSEKEVKPKDIASLRLSQQDYYNNGRGVLRIAAVEKSSQTGEYTCRSDKEDSWTTVSAKEDESDGESSDSLSSPQLCTRALTSSDNQSSDSDHVKCTCAELTSSKDSSSDPNHSGKSTLSQSVSDKSMSTQDSTVSINSISTRGSSISAASNSSSPDIDPKTSAKETTTSPEHTPSSQRENRDSKRRHRRDRDSDSGGNMERNRRHHYPPSNNKGNIGENSEGNDCNGKGNNKYGNQSSDFLSGRDHQINSMLQNGRYDMSACEEKVMTAVHSEPEPRTYEWSKCSKEELLLIQQQRNRRFTDNGRQFNAPLEDDVNSYSADISVCTNAGPTYPKTQSIEFLPLMIPRYSALPRSISMVVNTSSFDSTHQYSDSDCHSLSDSLEDGQSGRTPFYFDTKQEAKPVRGDVNHEISCRSVRKEKEPRGRAFFVSIDGEAETNLVTNIHKIPEPPEIIKNKIYQRHISICKSHDTANRIKELSNTTGDTSRKMKRKSKTRTRKQTKEKELKECYKSNGRSNRPNTKENKAGPKINKNCDPKESSSHTAESRSESPNNKEIENNVSDRRVAAEDKETSLLRPTSPKSEIVRAGDKIQKRETCLNEKSNREETKANICESPVSEDNKSDESIDSAASLEALHKHRMTLISSLENATSALKLQQSQLPQKQWNRPNISSKRPSNIKFQQKFEVIPEERSSSLTSSADELRSEKDRRHSLPVKLNNEANGQFLAETEGKSFRRYSLGSLSNYIIAKLMGKPLQAIPCVQRGPNNNNQQIVIFSPKDYSENNSSKGRDALLAMNREDFERLSKGWMNFYLLKEGSDNESAFEDDTALELEEEEEAEDNMKVNEDVFECSKVPDQAKLVCKIPPMEKDITTSGSGTDDPCLSPGHMKSTLLSASKSYSLQYNDNSASGSLVLVEASPITTQNNFSKVTTSTNFVDGQPHEKLKTESKNNANKIANLIQTTENGKNNIPNKYENPNILASTREVSTYTEPIKKFRSSKIEQRIKLSENVKLGSSNTVLKTTESILEHQKTVKRNRGFSLPELKQPSARASPRVKSRSMVEALPRIPITSGSDEIDSDSTVYMQAPSPQVPRLPLEEDSDSSNSDNETSPKQPYFPQRRKGPAFRNRNFNHGSKSGNPGWSVTVAGTVAFPRTTPDLQMRLSFPVDSGPPIISQSDSGFVEDVATRSRGKKKQQWTVTVNPHTGSREKTIPLHQSKTSSSEQTTSHKGKKLNDSVRYESSKLEIERKFSEIWPKIQEVIENEFNSESFRQTSMDDSNINDPPLTIRGKAVTMDTKPRATKLSNGDVTRNTTARSSLTTDEIRLRQQ